MRRMPLGCLAIALLAAAFTAPTAAGQPTRMTFGDLIIEGRSFRGSIRERGPWEWEGPVTVRAPGFVMTCDALKLWPTADGGDFERVEADGNIRIEGSYRSADETEWEVDGRADSAEYDKTRQQSVLSGSVTFRAKNRATGRVVSVAAERLTYDVKAERFRFEQGDTPVRMEWQPQPPAEPSGESPAQPEAEKADEG